jgi:hypothetical protein
MLTCKETTHLLSAAQDRPLGFRERLELRLHLLICQGCTNYRKQIDFVRAACGRLKAPDGKGRGEP